MKYCLKEVTFLHHSRLGIAVVVVIIVIVIVIVVIAAATAATFFLAKLMTRYDCVLCTLSAAFHTVFISFFHSVFIMNLLM